MAKTDNTNFPHKGKPAGRSNDEGNFEDITNELNEVNEDDISLEEAEIRHPNRNLRKGEDAAQYNDDDDNDE